MTQLYAFTKLAHWQRPNKGPLIEPTYDKPKTGGEKETALDYAWPTYLRRLNPDEKAYKHIISKTWAPTKGFNDHGKLRWIRAVYPGNVVMVDDQEIGIDGKLYYRLVGLPITSPPSMIYNWIDHPHLIHRVCGSNNKGTAEPLPHAPFVPNLCNGRWIDADLLWRIDVCHVELTVGRILNPIITVCSDKTYKSKTNLWLSIGTKATVTGVSIGEHGLWGEIAGGWIPLRYRGSQMTNWKI